jgi:hypothetical protein
MNRADLEILDAWADRWRTEWSVTCHTMHSALDQRDWDLVEDCRVRLMALMSESLTKLGCNRAPS